MRLKPNQQTLVLAFARTSAASCHGFAARLTQAAERRKTFPRTQGAASLMGKGDTAQQRPRLIFVLSACQGAIERLDPDDLDELGLIMRLLDRREGRSRPRPARNFELTTLGSRKGR